MRPRFHITLFLQTNCSSKTHSAKKFALFSWRVILVTFLLAQAKYTRKTHFITPVNPSRVKNDPRLTISLFFAALVVGGSLYLRPNIVKADPEVKPKTKVTKPRYSQFPHEQKAHRLDCAACHKFPSDNWSKVRTGDAAFPDQTDYPKHDSCVKCHKQQFFKGARPAICSICHTNPSPRDSSRHPFPNPREVFDVSPKGKIAESDFVVSFPHDKHIDIVAKRSVQPKTFVNIAFSRRSTEESCSVCHQTMKPQGDSDDEYLTKPPADIGDAFWLKKGTFKSAPIGHTTCFTCHSVDAGILPAPQTCSACHQLKMSQPTADFDRKDATKMIGSDKVMMDAWSKRISAGAFRHEFASHAELSCATCHDVLTIKTESASTKKVGISSCATCHVTATSDDGGALNYEADMRKGDAAFQCTKCHITFGKKLIPVSHTKALADAAAQTQK